MFEYTLFMAKPQAEYRDIPAGEVKITIQKEDRALHKSRKTFNAIELDTRNFTFNREEANAR